MVNRGRSGGCVTCKQRRIKCDEEKPQCWHCKRLKLKCGGYTTKKELKFKDETHKFIIVDEAAERESLVPVGPAASPDVQIDDSGTMVSFKEKQVFGKRAPLHTGSSIEDLHDDFCTSMLLQCLLANGNDQPTARLFRPIADPDTAVPFFLGHYATMGRDMGAARGFFEMLVPVYAAEPVGSPLTLAVSAVATEILSLWRDGPSSFQSTRKSYTEAVTSLRRSLKNDTERARPATALAVLALQLYENIAAVWTLRSASAIHQNGAVSLLSFIESEDATDVVSAYTRQYLLHIEVSSAMRQKRPAQSVACSWLGRKDLLADPENPSARLDAIGVSIAEFQSLHAQLAKNDTSWATTESTFFEWTSEARRLDKELLEWRESMPEHWRPVKLQSGQDIDESIETYEGVCEIYPSCQIANLWNFWRSQRLILLKVLVVALDLGLSHALLNLQCGLISSAYQDFIEYKTDLQELVDSMCYSVPFYLGNRTMPAHLDDFGDANILLPSSDRVGTRPNNNTEHKQHIIARGPSHVLSGPLSHVLALLSEDDGLTIAGFLRPGQLDWIRRQFVRVAMLLRLTSVHHDGPREKRQHVANETIGLLGKSGAEKLAEGVRRGAMIMSGL